jgi:hypothetical protein
MNEDELSESPGKHTHSKAQHATLFMDLGFAAKFFNDIYIEMKWYQKGQTENTLFRELNSMRQEILRNVSLENLSRGKLRVDRIGDFGVIYRLTPEAEKEYEDS